MYSSTLASSRSSAGAPRLPPARIFRPARSAICASSVVTVLLPLVPVMPTTGARAARANNSMSPTMLRPRARAASKNGPVSATPGETTTRSACSSSAASKPPVRTTTSPPSAASRCSSGGSARLSVTATCEPLREQEARRRQAGLAQTDHHRAQRHWRGCAHRSFSVDRPASTSRKLMIQKRTITFGSAQPLSSK